MKHKNLLILLSFLILTSIGQASMYAPANFGHDDLRGLRSQRRGISAAGAGSASTATIYSGQSSRSVESGVSKCNKLLENLEQLIAYQDFDRFLFVPNDDKPLPDFSKYDLTKHSDLHLFYSDNLRDRDIAALRIYDSFVKIIDGFSTISYTHPEFEILSYASSSFGPWNDIHIKKSSTIADFTNIFQNTDELKNLKKAIEALREVSIAIDINSAEKGAKEDELSAKLNEIPIILVMANRFYLPSVEKAYKQDLITLDATKFEGKLSLTRLLINYGELLKALPSKKNSDVGKVCITFRDKAVKVLARRIDKLKSDDMTLAYAPLNDFLLELHDYIFNNTTVPEAAPIIEVLKQWGYKPNGKSISSAAGAGSSATASTGGDEEVDYEYIMSFLVKMREIADIKFDVPTMILMNGENSLFSDFKNSLNGFINTLRRIKDIDSVSGKQKRRFTEDKIESQSNSLHASLENLINDNLPIWLDGKDLNKKEDVQQIIELRNQALTDFYNTQIEPLIPQNDEVNPITMFDTSVESLTSSIDLKYTRLYHLRLLLSLSHYRSIPIFTQSFGATKDLTQKLLEASEEDKQALRLLGYTFVQTVKDNIGNLPGFTDSINQIVALRKYWAHPKVTDFDWEKVLESNIQTRKEKLIENECQALAILMTSGYSRAIQFI